MEITSELISDTQRRNAVELASGLCLKACAVVADQEAGEIARATLHEAINSSARFVAESVVVKAAPGARDTVDHYLRDSSKYPNIMQVVADAAEPAARDAALAAVRAWSKDRAMIAATEAARKVLNDQLPALSNPILESAVLATLLVLLDRSSGQQDDDTLHAVLGTEAEKAAIEAATRAFTPELRRAAQTAAVIAAGAIAKDAGEEVASEAAESAARQAAAETVRQEVMALIKAEAQRRAAKLTREALKDVTGVPKNKVQQHCYDEAMRMARQASEGAISEIAHASLEVDSQRVYELSAAAASAVAREVSDALAPAKKQTQSWTTIFVAAQASIGCVLIWYFVLGGSGQLPALLKPVLPTALYDRLFPAQAAPPPNSVDEPSDPRLNDVLDGGSESSNTPQPPADRSVEDIDLDKPIAPEPSKHSSTAPSPAPAAPGTSPPPGPTAGSSAEQAGKDSTPASNSSAR
ncbi:MAG: hypothetical protein K2W95_07880 [Candidatus Obscuribacterales bacterium]|nr:hypothetical protein [Candidatus Obscuribacterales bacterium]